MQTVTLQYREDNTLMASILHTAILAGAKVKVIDPKKKDKILLENTDVLSAYQEMFGKRKDNKYTETEVFIFNSKLNAANTLAKYL